MPARDPDPRESELEADTTEQPPLSGTVDDDDDRDDEHWDENEAPVQELSDRQETRDEFRLDEREEDPEVDEDDDDESEGVN